MTFDEFRQQIIDFIGFEPGNPANHAYTRNKVTEVDAMLPWAPGATKSNTTTYYYDENDQLLYEVCIDGLSYSFGSNQGFSPFAHLPDVNRYTITCDDFEYTVKRVYNNCSVPTIQYIVYKIDRNVPSYKIQPIIQHFEWQIEE